MVSGRSDVLHESATRFPRQLPLECACVCGSRDGGEERGRDEGESGENGSDSSCDTMTIHSGISELCHKAGKMSVREDKGKYIQP